MKQGVYIILLAIAVVSIYFYYNGCGPKEFYGQDASIRLGAGGLAGPGMYGEDPVAVFARQIRDQRLEREISTGRQTMGPVDSMGPMCSNC